MKMAMRFYVAALFAIAVGTAFAQVTDDSGFKQRLADAAAKYNSKKGSTSDAISDFTSLYGENPKSPDVNSWLGFLYLRNREPRKAIPYLETAKDLSPKDLEVLNNLGNAYMLSDQNQKAIGTYQQLIAFDPNRFEAYYNMGNLQLKEGRNSQAEASFGRALGMKKNAAQIYNNLGVAQEAQAKVEKASGSFMKASDLEPKNAVYARNAGSEFHKMRSFSNAVTYLERAIKNGSQEKEVILALADSYNQVGRKADVTKLYENYQDSFAGDPKFYYNLGILKKNAKDYDGAETAFRKSLSINEADKDCLNNLGVILFNKGNFSEARSMFDKVVAIDPSYSNRKNLAAAEARDGDYRDAMPIWSDLLKTKPTDQEVRLLLDDALYDTGDTKASLVLYKQIIATNPNSAPALDGIGRCHLQDSSFAAAEAALRSAIKADKSYVPAYNNLAVVLEKMNKRAEAISYLEKAASMDANNADVQKNLKRMKSAG